jgi:hypothetical protein
MKEPTTNPKGRKYSGGIPNLDELENIDLFPEKTAKAREMLKRAGLPPELRDRQVKK